MSLRLPNSHGIISINSNDQIPNSNRTFQDLYGNFNCNTRNIKKWGVYKSQFINKSPTIGINNNIIRWSEGGMSYEVIIVEGFYNPTELGAQIETQMNVISPSGTFIVSVDETKRTATISNVTQFTLLPVENHKSPATMMGWLDVQHTDTTELINGAEGRYNLNYTDYVDIVSYQLNQENRSDDYSTNKRVTNILDRIYLSDDPQQVVHNNENSFIKWIDVNSEFNLNNLEIQLKDDRGNDYYIDNYGTSYSILILTQ